MSKDLFERRDPPIPSQLWRPSVIETERLQSIAARPRNPGALACELMMLADMITNRSKVFDPVSFQGLLQRMDDTRLALAMSPAVDDVDLNVKLSLLFNAEPAIPTNKNMRAMIMAGLQADVDRLRPTDPRFRLDRRHT